MMKKSVFRSLIILSSVLAFLGTFVSAQAVKVQGQIKSRSGATMTLHTTTSPNFTVILTDSTQVGQKKGAFKARRKQMSMAALIPGLTVDVEGTYNADNELVARSVAFTGDDLERAYSIQAGLHETKVQAQKNEEELAKQNAALKAQNEALQQQQAQLTEHQAKIAANKAAIDAAIARFGQLDDYYIFDEVTVLFGNGKTKVDPQYIPQLTALAQKAKTIDGYMVQVEGHASSVGSAALNQKLSADRADNVTNILLQQGRVPLTNMLAPGAMGESQQTSTGTSSDSQAQDRRVVVRVLQNKGVAGLE
jgi:outer membrane protein OmpA-like peptidoglycan-associated protein